MTPAISTVASGLAQLACESVGAGIPVVFLHAGVADRRMWRQQMAAVAQASHPFHAIAYDRRGFGETLHVEERYSQTGDLIAVLDALAPRRPAILVGSSQGGRIAIDAALADPAHVRALVLVAPAISGAPDVTLFPPAIQDWIENVERAEDAADVDRINALEAHAWLDGPLAPEGRVSGPARDLFLAMNELALRAEQCGTEIAPPAAFGRLQEITAPSLIVWGDLDFPHIVQRCEWMGTSIPAARTHVLRDAAHLPSLEQPREFNRVLLDFLAAVIA